MDLIYCLGPLLATFINCLTKGIVVHSGFINYLKSTKLTIRLKLDLDSHRPTIPCPRLRFPPSKVPFQFYQFYPYH